ncbi:hypothetical protein [Natrinema marinum]|uniref:hypothetical protein n=1 Tax=Natrinema marinum TaxID=2961598 RepID=UPI0020C912CA|nr:hypothetical protein [Natrinema marinum]
MTDTDEKLLTLAKLREQITGDLEGDDRIKSHAGIVASDRDRRSLNFVDDVVSERGDLDATAFADTDLGDVLYPNFLTDAASRAVDTGDASLASYLVGVTEQEFDGSNMTVALRLLEELHNNGAPAFVAGAGNPETGKTNTMYKLVELTDRAFKLIEEFPDELMVISNSRSWERTDKVCTSAHDLAVTCLRHRSTPKFIVIDESSTHFDARTYSYEVANQWTPLAKRFAKIGVYACGNIFHSGRDYHPEGKRLTTLAFWKDEKTEAEFFQEWGADADRPSEPLFPDLVQNFEKYDGYDPSDSAPWAWNLEPGLFQEDKNWQELLDVLEDPRGD